MIIIMIMNIAIIVIIISSGSVSYTIVYLQYMVVCR